MGPRREAIWRSRRAETASLRGPIACAVLAIAALSLGPSGEAVVRSAVRDAALPGALLNRRLADLRTSLDIRRWPWTADAAADALISPAAENDDAERELRILRVALAAAHRDAAAFERSLGPVRRATSSPYGIERIPARILGSAPDSQGETLVLASGTSSGAAADQFAVEPVIVTSEDDLPENAPVLAGAAVVGRTQGVGRWTATVLPVTHKDYRGHVRLIRMTATGPVYGEEGILEGDGHDGCVVRYVPSTAPVAVGDHVYAHDPTGHLPQPLYYGRVERAELRDGAPHWEIAVHPAAEPGEFTELHVLVPTGPDPSLARTP